jgi:chromosome segregation ATPase
LIFRIHEKSEEAIALRGVIDLERSRVDNLTHELHSSKRECEKWSQEATSWKTKCNESASRLDEVSRSLESALETVHTQKEELMILRHDGQNEKGHKASLQAEIEKRSEMIEILKKDIRGLKEENERMKSLTEGVEGTSRDNERFKAALAASQNDLSKLELKNEHLSSSNASLQSELAKRDIRIDDLVDELTLKSDKMSGMSEDIDDLKVALSNEKSKVVALEAALTEHRAMSHSLQSELDSVKEHKMIDERKFSEEGNRLMHARSDFGKTCSVVLHALLKWDKVLVLAMESFDIHDRDITTRGLLSFSKGSSSAPHGNLLWSEGYSASGNDTMTVVDSMLDRPDELLQSSVAIVERIQVKLERLMKIRRLFEAKSNQMVNEVQLKLKHAEDSVELLTHKIGTMQQLVRNTEDIVLKEKRTRDESNQSMRSFQESVVSGHTKQIRELEEKCTTYALSLQDSQHKVRSLEHEVAVLQEEISILNEDRERLADAEEVVAKLKTKFDEVAHSNQLMSYEIEDRGGQIDDLKDKLRGLDEDNNRLAAAATALKHQIELRDKVLNEQETQLSGLKVEINHLKHHQIDPKLEKSIMESQDVLRASLSNRHDASEYHRSLDDRSVMLLQKISANASELLNSAKVLVRDTQSIVQDFEESHHSSALDMGTSYGLRTSSVLGQGAGAGALSQSVLDLLNANAKLALQVQHALTDLKKMATGHLSGVSSGSGSGYGRDVSPQTKKESSANPLDLSHLTGSRGLSMDMLSTSRNHEGATSFSSSTRQHHNADRFNDENVDKTSQSRDRDFSYKTVLRDDEFQPYHSGGRQASSSRESVSFSGIRDQPQREDISFRSDNLPTSSHGYRPSSSSFIQSSSSQRFADRGNSSTGSGRDDFHGHSQADSNRITQQSSKTQHYQSHGRSSHSSSGGYRLSNSSSRIQNQGTTSPSTKTTTLQQHQLLRSSSRDSPMGRGQVARESASRLSKLGTDLQSLAAKLDSFDVRHSTR